MAATRQPSPAVRAGSRSPARRGRSAPPTWLVNGLGRMRASKPDRRQAECPRDTKDEISSSGRSACSVTAAANWRTRCRSRWVLVALVSMSKRAGRTARADASVLRQWRPAGWCRRWQTGVCAGFRRNAAAGSGHAGVNANMRSGSAGCSARMRGNPVIEVRHKTWGMGVDADPKRLRVGNASMASNRIDEQRDRQIVDDGKPTSSSAPSATFCRRRRHRARG